ncbi:DUF1707 SHOCT-like domain-containing protein [Amycolatopsis thermoflava]|uniref:DUF1707 SHOCT-like domain-containing protein n=1 Tax=Amycolatopsis thermoflava TaxID=84480 RepID=UPI00380621F0
MVMEPGIRASDEDRERVVATLRREVGTGRLTLDEFSQRAEDAYRARTIGELEALTRDLPAVHRARTPSPFPSPVMIAVVLAVVLSVGALILAGFMSAPDMGHMMGSMGH